MAGGSNLRVGMDLESCTSHVQRTDEFALSGRSIILIDTSGAYHCASRDARLKSGPDTAVWRYPDPLLAPNGKSRGRSGLPLHRQLLFPSAVSLSRDLTLRISWSPISVLASRCLLLYVHF
jgi:hypothetical protein